MGQGSWPGYEEDQTIKPVKSYIDTGTKDEIKKRQEKVIVPEYVDDDGNPLYPGEILVRITHGQIRRTTRPGFALLTGAESFAPFTIKKTYELPPSVIVPEKMVFKIQSHEKKVHYLIPSTDFSRYVHWHQAADPESRRTWISGKFSFRHRVAACRNLLSALISITRAGLYPFSLSSRSVFTGPDASVRIIAVSRDNARTDEEATLTLLSMSGPFMHDADGRMPSRAGCRQGCGVRSWICPITRLYSFPCARSFQKRLV